MKLSVVMPARNSEAVIGRALDALQTQEEAPDEIIVVDDASKDRTAEVAESHGARVLRSSTRIYTAGGRNLGAATAEGDVLSFLDADDVALPGWSIGMRRAFEAGAAFVAGGLELEPSENLLHRYSAARTFGHDLESGNGFLPNAAGANIAMRRDVFEKLGGFETGLISAEDTDISWRAILEGYELTHAPAATVRYTLRPSLRRYVKQRFRRSYNSPRLTIKYQHFVFGSVSKRADTRRIWYEAAKGAVLGITGLAGKDFDLARVAGLDAVTLLTLRTGRTLGWLSLFFTKNPPPIPLQPRDSSKALAATPLVLTPSAIVVGDDDVALRVIARALQADAGLSAPPPGLWGDLSAHSNEPPPWAPSAVDRARAYGWRIHRDLGAKRLETVRPKTWFDAYIALQGISAWLQGGQGFVIVERRAPGNDLADRLTEVPLVSIGGTQTSRAPTLTFDAEELRSSSQEVVGRLAEFVRFRNPEVTERALKIGMMVERYKWWRR